jgi:hypothetical protein
VPLATDQTVVGSNPAEGDIYMSIQITTIDLGSSSILIRFFSSDADVADVLDYILYHYVLGCSANHITVKTNPDWSYQLIHQA